MKQLAIRIVRRIAQRDINMFDALIAIPAIYAATSYRQWVVALILMLVLPALSSRLEEI